MSQGVWSGFWVPTPTELGRTEPGLAVKQAFVTLGLESCSCVLCGSLGSMAVEPGPALRAALSGTLVRQSLPSAMGAFHLLVCKWKG